MTSAAIKGEEPPMSVVIIGGSLAGLMHGVMIKQLGYNFFKQHDLYPYQYSFDCPGFQSLDKNANIKRRLNIPLNSTSWNVLYYRLRANFDLFKSGFCPDPPTSSENKGTASYDVGKKAINIVYKDQLVEVEFVEISTGGTRVLEVDLVIVADGANSTLRQRLLPNVRHQYSGHVAWRGTVPEEDVSEETRKLFNTRFNVFQMSQGYIVGYSMPGKNGVLAAGQRLLNWVWYFNCPKDTPGFNENMTDVNGYTHRNTLPAGKMQPETWQKHKNHASQVLTPPFLELVNKTAEHFISTVNDCASTKASFFNGKLLLVGEALTLLRPHTGMSFNHAAVNCLLLQRFLKGEMPIVQWKNEVLRYAEKTRLLSACVGSYYHSGLLSSTFLLSMIRYLFALLRHALFSIRRPFHARV